MSLVSFPGFAFLHVPRTGGRSVLHFLRQCFPEHHTLCENHPLLAEARLLTDQSIVATFREPCDWLKSMHRRIAHEHRKYPEPGQGWIVRPGLLSGDLKPFFVSHYRKFQRDTMDAFGRFHEEAMALRCDGADHVLDYVSLETDLQKLLGCDISLPRITESHRILMARKKD